MTVFLFYSLGITEESHKRCFENGRTGKFDKVQCNNLIN